MLSDCNANLNSEGAFDVRIFEDGKVQGLSQRRSENNGLLLPKYESEGLPDPTGGSTDVVHLLIYVSLVFK